MICARATEQASRPKNTIPEVPEDVLRKFGLWYDDGELFVESFRAHDFAQALNESGYFNEQYYQWLISGMRRKLRWYRARSRPLAKQVERMLPAPVSLAGSRERPAQYPKLSAVTSGYQPRPVRRNAFTPILRLASSATIAALIITGMLLVRMLVDTLSDRTPRRQYSSAGAQPSQPADLSSSCSTSADRDEQASLRELPAQPLAQNPRGLSLKATRHPFTCCYLVRSGESLWHIWQQLGGQSYMPWAEFYRQVVALNSQNLKVSAGKMLKPGWRLLVPAGKHHACSTAQAALDAQ